MSEMFRDSAGSQEDLQGRLQPATGPAAAVRETTLDGPFTARLTNAPQSVSRATAGDNARATPAGESAPESSLASPEPPPGLSLDYIAPALRPLAVPISELRPMRDNARLHGHRDVTALAESLRQFGQQKAIVARAGTGEVIAGNGTLAAARRLRWSHVAVSWFHGSEKLARQFAIADNRTSELSEWDLAQLAKDAADVDLSAWFSEREMHDLLAQLGSDAPPLDFGPVDASAQGQLDALKRPPVTCPRCAHVFTPEGP